MKAHCRRCNGDQEVEIRRRIIRYTEPEFHGVRYFTDFVCSRCSCAVLCLEGNTPLGLNDFAMQVHAANAHWWKDPKTGAPIDPNFGEKIALCHSELSEALEGHRKNLMDDKLPHRKMAEVELVDCMIRMFDMAGYYGFDLQGAYEEKMAYNAQRVDHKPENRIKEGGKAY